MPRKLALARLVRINCLSTFRAPGSVDQRFTDRGPILWRVRACVSGTARRFNLCHGHAAIAQPAECQRVRRGSLTLNFAAARTSRIIGMARARLASASLQRRLPDDREPIGKFFKNRALHSSVRAATKIWLKTKN